MSLRSIPLMVVWVIIAVVALALVSALAFTGWRLRAAFVIHEEEAGTQQAAKETLGKLRELAGRVAQQVDEHSHKVEEISDELASLDKPDEADVLVTVNKLIDVNEQMKAQLQAAEDRLQAQARQIESHAVEARTDPLTQVANRRALEDELRRCVDDYQQRGRPLSVMIIDVDNFKKFNDSHGHQAGDEILRGVARVLRQSTAEANLVARYGGEEFAIVFPGATFGAARETAEKARLAIASARFRYEGRELRVTASAGLAELVIGETEASLVKRADEALYASKHAGRNCGHFNDGFANHPIKLENTRAPSTPAKTGKPVVGDEWLYETVAQEIAEDDPAAQVSSRPIFFDNMIERLSILKKLPKTKLSLLLVQLDGLEKIRNEHGVSAGSIVVRVAAQIFKASLRDLDQISRLEDNTFSILLPGIQGTDALDIAQRIQAAVSRYPLPKRAGVTRVSVAIGVAEASHADDLQAVLRRARKALDAAMLHPGQRLFGITAQDGPMRASNEE
ncbi:GGDEF domain-containing protein [Anatilimnocola sp. NA78]|uniref:GGDEF domain-containing protein n=1 Tax=Anatilimnocola sp. NA78 TaxID=3415683 RepID=UPI003CE4E462